jgi:predicted Zn-dependent protease with MMP-like domain
MQTMSCEVTRTEFDAMVQDAIASLPERFRVALEVVRVEVRDRPSLGQLKSVDLDESDLLLGLYEGTPLTERSVTGGSELPDVIYLFREDHEDATDSPEQMREEVRVTLLHELGHYFGFDEEELERLGFE